MSDEHRIRLVATAHGTLRIVRWPPRGAGPAVVLLHGLGQDAFAWRDVVPTLQAAGATVFAPDLPGHGQSAMPSGAGIDAVAQELTPALRAAADDADRPLHIVAHSYSAPAAVLAAASLAAERVAALAFVCPLGVIAPAAGLVPTLPPLLTAAVRQLARRPEAVRSAVSHLLARPDSLSQEAWRGLARSLGQADLLWRYGNRLLEAVPPLLPALSALGRQALFLWGASDPVFAWDEAEAAVRSAPEPGPGAHRLERLDASGHLPMLETPEALGKAVAVWATGG